MSDGGWIGLGIRLFVNSFTKPGPPCGAWVFKKEPFPPRALNGLSLNGWEGLSLNGWEGRKLNY